MLQLLVRLGYMQGQLQADWSVPCCAVLIPELCWASCAVRCRYIVSQPASISAKFITDTLKAAFPAAAALPDGKESDASHINSRRIETDLGLQYTPVADTVRDMAQALLQCGIAQPAWYAASI